MTADVGAPSPQGEATSWLDAADPCRSCGACCAYSASWPRFSLEDDAALARISPALINADESGMRCIGDRCAALSGEVGAQTSCSIYVARPEVCRACLPGDDACLTARRHFGIVT